MKLDEKLLSKLKDRKISIEDLSDDYFVEHVCEPPDDRWGSPYSHSEFDVENALKLLINNICSFKELVDRTEKIQDPYNRSCLSLLLYDIELFEKLTQNGALNKEDLKYILNKINNSYDLAHLCKTTPLIKHILNEFVLNKEAVDKFNTLIEKGDLDRGEKYKNHNVHNTFDLIKFFATYDWWSDMTKIDADQELLELIELNRKLYLLSNFDLNEKKKLEVSELLQNNEIAQNRLIQIVENHLESSYDFDSLMKYLKKKEKKNLINI